MNFEEYVKRILSQNDLDDLYQSLLAIETYLSRYQTKEIQQCKIGFGDLKDGNYLLFEWYPDNHCSVSLYVEGRYEGSANKEELTVRELLLHTEKLVEKIAFMNLSFAPPYPKAFEEELWKTSVGSGVFLNTRMTLLCTKKTKEELCFRECFCGNPSSLHINQFRRSKEYHITRNSREEIQKLWNYAYSHRKQSYILRNKVFFQDGYDFMHKIEQDTLPGEVKEKSIGDVRIRIAKYSDQAVWYDSDNVKLDRQTVASLFTYALHQIPEISVTKIGMSAYDRELTIPSEKVAMYKALLMADIQKVSSQGYYQQISSLLFQFSELCKEPSVLNITSLEGDGEGNFKEVTFSFSIEDGEKRIVKTEYSEYLPSSYQVMTEREFTDFCKRSYGENLVSDKIHYEIHPMREFVKNSPEKQAREAFGKYVSSLLQEKENPYQVTRTTIGEEGDYPDGL